MQYKAGPKWRPHRDMCTALDILPLVRDGWLRPGIRHGEVQSLGYLDQSRPISIPFRLVSREDGGILTVEWPSEQDIEIVRVETRCGHRFLFRCPGGDDDVDPPSDCPRRTRRLLLPSVPAGFIVPPFACAKCWAVSYRPASWASRLEVQVSLERLQARLDVLKRNQELFRGLH
jgi:hypothetical protein